MIEAKQEVGLMEAIASAGAEASTILIFGGTGYIGKYMVKASIKLGHKTFVYTRPITPQSDPDKMNLHKEFESIGATIIQVLLINPILSNYIYIYMHARVHVIKFFERINT